MVTGLGTGMCRCTNCSCPALPPSCPLSPCTLCVVLRVLLQGLALNLVLIIGYIPSSDTYSERRFISAIENWLICLEMCVLYDRLPVPCRQTPLPAFRVGVDAFQPSQLTARSWRLLAPPRVAVRAPSACLVVCLTLSPAQVHHRHLLLACIPRRGDNRDEAHPAGSGRLAYNSGIRLFVTQG